MQFFCLSRHTLLGAMQTCLFCGKCITAGFNDHGNYKYGPNVKALQCCMSHNYLRALHAGSHDDLPQSGSCSPSTTSIIQAGALPAQPGNAAASFAHASATHQAAPRPASRGLSLEQHPTNHLVAKLDSDTAFSDKQVAQQPTGQHDIHGMTASPAAGDEELVANDYNYLGPKQVPPQMLTLEGIRCVGRPAATSFSLGPMTEQAAPAPAAMRSPFSNGAHHEVGATRASC